jgi:hypothetical protein
MWMLPVIQGFWLGYVRTVTVGTTSSMHLLMKPMTEVVYSSMPFSQTAIPEVACADFKMKGVVQNKFITDWIVSKPMT